MDEIKSLMDQSIDNIREELWALGDSIYDNPEVALHEVFASTLLEDWLEQHGFNVTRGLGTMSTAFRATYENGAGGPSIGLLCEYDALPRLGHACGHHLQGPCIIAAANAIKNANIDKPYKLVIYGTPAEENLAGKITMLEEGCFRDIDVALMMHGSPTTTCDIKSMANYHIDVVFEGKSSHAAINPDKGRSALDALLLTFQGIEFLREHVPEDSRMHYTVADTYNIPANVVPDKAKGSFILRSFNMYTLENIFSRFERIVHGAAEMTETMATIKVQSHMAAKIPVLSLNKLLIDCAEEIGAPRISGPRKKPGSTDFANVMEIVPGSCIRVAFVPENAASHSQEILANGKAETGHNAIIYGAKVLANAAYEMIKDDSLLAEIKDEFIRNKNKMKEEA